MINTNFFNTLSLIVVSLLLLTFASSSMAANLKGQNTRITFIQSWTDNSVFVTTDEQSKTNPANCSYTAQYVMKSDASEISQSMLFSAYAAGKKVTLTITGDECTGNRPLIVAVRLQEL